MAKLFLTQKEYDALDPALIAEIVSSGDAIEIAASEDEAERRSVAECGGEIAATETVSEQEFALLQEMRRQTMILEAMLARQSGEAASKMDPPSPSPTAGHGTRESERARQ